MGKVTVNSMILVLIFSITVCCTALSAATSDNKATAIELDSSKERNPLQYHLVTLPTTNKKRVDAMCIKFLSLIPRAVLIPRTAESTVYRLIANSFDTIESAKKRKAELVHQCDSPFVVKIYKGYSVVASSQLTETSALEEKKRLESKNISTTILELRLPLKHWQMKSTESFNIRDAVTMASKLAKIGVVTIIEPAPL